jgi:hypothetical protein
MQIYTRVVVQPLGGGETVTTFDGREDPKTVDFDTILASYSQRFGDPFEVAYTTSSDIKGPIQIGWVFAVPDKIEVPASLEDFEMLLIPMFDDLNTGERLSLFLSMARKGQQFRDLFDGGAFDELHTFTAPQRDPDQPQHFEHHSQRRDHEG